MLDQNQPDDEFVEQQWIKLWFLHIILNQQHFIDIKIRTCSKKSEWIQIYHGNCVLEIVSIFSLIHITCLRLSHLKTWKMHLRQALSDWKIVY